MEKEISDTRYKANANASLEFIQKYKYNSTRICSFLWNSLL